MSISRNSNSEVRGTTGTSTTVAHTTVAGKNLALFSGVECQTGDNVTGVTANGLSMTQYAKVLTNVASFENYFYYLKNPPIGTFNVVTSWSGSRTVITLNGAYSGVDQTTPLEANNNNQSTASAFTVAVTTLTTGAWLLGTFRNNSAGTQSAGSGTSYITGDAGDVGYKLYDSNGPTTAGSNSLNVNFTVSSLYTGFAVSIKPASGGQINYDTGVSSTDWTSLLLKSTPSFTVAANSNRLMIARIFFSAGGVDGMSTLKWNTTEIFTLGAKIQNPGNEWEYVYYLVNPTATTSTVDAVSTSAASHGRIVVDVYYGAGTPSQFTTNSSSTGFTATLTVAANSWLGWLSGAQRDTTIVSGGTVRQLSQSLASMDSNADLPAGSQSIQGNWSGATNSIIYFEIPSAGGTAYTSTLTDSITITDSFVRSLGKILLETYTLVTTLMKQTNRPFKEAVIVQDIYKNFCPNPNFETDITNWSQYVNGGAGVNPILSQDTTTSNTGVASLKVVTQGASYANSGASFGVSGLVIGQMYTVSGYVKGTVGDNINIYPSNPTLTQSGYNQTGT